MIKPLLFLVLISCASKEKSIFPQDAVITPKEFSSPKEAQNFVRNKWTYLSLLFEQSFDPYYGTPKWAPDCLKKNTFSKVTEDSGNVFFTSQLMLNDRSESGFCEGNFRDVIYLQCQDESRAYEITCAPGNCLRIPFNNPCPVKK